MAVVLALASAVVYGAADFLGGLASRRTSVFGVVAMSQVVGLVALLALLPWLGGPVGVADLAWGWRRGLAGAAGLVVFFRALAGGVMSVIAPVTAVTAAAVPVLVGLLAGNRIGGWAAAGIALALTAVVLVSAEGGLRACARPARPAWLRPRSWPARRSGSSSCCSTAPRRPRGSPRWSRPGWRRSRWWSWWRWRAGSRCGSPARAPARGAVRRRRHERERLFLLATQQEGQLAITGVLASLYPVSTVLLAQVLLRERLVRGAGRRAGGRGRRRRPDHAARLTGHGRRVSSSSTGNGGRPAPRIRVLPHGSCSIASADRCRAGCG